MFVQEPKGKKGGKILIKMKNKEENYRKDEKKDGRKLEACKQIHIPAVAW